MAFSGNNIKHNRLSAYSERREDQKEELEMMRSHMHDGPDNDYDDMGRSTSHLFNRRKHVEDPYEDDVSRSISHLTRRQSSGDNLTFLPSIFGGSEDEIFGAGEKANMWIIASIVVLILFIVYLHTRTNATKHFSTNYGMYKNKLKSFYHSRVNNHQVRHHMHSDDAGSAQCGGHRKYSENSDDEDLMKMPKHARKYHPFSKGQEKTTFAPDIRRHFKASECPDQDPKNLGDYIQA